MEILVYKDNSIFEIGAIEKGTFGGNEELYKVTDEYGVEHYAVTNGFTPYKVESVPDDFTPAKYCYSAKKGFYVNPNYSDVEPVEERITALEETIAAQDELLAMLLLGE